METIARVRREHLGKGVPIKQIARELRLSLNTVGRVVRSGETLFRSRGLNPRPTAYPARVVCEATASDPVARRRVAPVDRRGRLA